jgi:radical SAM protein with 4Fe4S-binding SPASM domain
MRATRGSFRAATAALQHLKAAGVRTGSNINLNRLNERDLEPLYEHLRDLGISAWQVQLTAPLGRAADRPAMIFQPWDLLTLLPRIDAIKKRAFEEARIVLQPGNNLGYFGPEEARLRSPAPGMTDHFQGCQAGRQLLGIESNGDVKGCPSLQTSHYVGGNLREQPLAALWESAPALQFTRRRTVEDLWGFCRTCPFAAHCLGGCSFTAHSLLGRPGNNPYCHYRARAFAERGLRERLVPRERAPGNPFDSAQFDIIEEPSNAPDHRMPSPTALARVWPIESVKQDNTPG